MIIPHAADESALPYSDIGTKKYFPARDQLIDTPLSARYTDRVTSHHQREIKQVADTNNTHAAMARELREGESIARSTRIPVTEIKRSPPTKILAKMRNSMNQIASRAREATDRFFRVESGQFVTHDGQAVMCVVTLTCTEDEGEDDI